MTHPTITPTVLMNPIAFACEKTLSAKPEEIGAKILDVANWSEFPGCWPIPGIRSAEFDVRTPEVVGSRIRVVSTDGSSHVETITAWRLPETIVLEMGEFSPPLSRLAAKFVETWSFQPDGAATHVVRRFELYPKTLAAKPAFWAISFFLKRAVERHLEAIERTTGPSAT